jgi:hypothetical protein
VKFDSARLERHRYDVAIVLVLAAVAALLSIVLSSRLLPAMSLDYWYRDVWFQADLDAVAELASSRLSSRHYRNAVHPFYSITVHPLVQLIRLAPGMDLISALRVMTAAVAGLWAALLYATLRLQRWHKLDASLVTILGISTASFWFFFAVADSFSLGALSVTSALFVFALGSRYRVPLWGYVAIVLATFGYVLTNVMAGLAASLVSLRRVKQVVFVVAVAAAGAVALLAVQKEIYPSLETAPSLDDELPFVRHPSSGGPKRIVPAFFLHSVVAPDIQLVQEPEGYGNAASVPYILSVQHSEPGSATSWGPMLVGAWALLLTGGAWAAVRDVDTRPFASVIALYLAGQLTLHLIYGEETFLYSLNYVTALVVVPAFALRTRFRPIVISGMLLLAVGLWVNNAQAFVRAQEAVAGLPVANQ